MACPPVWHQWQLSQTAWAYNRVLEIAPPIAARSVFPLVKEKVVEQIQQLREAFLKLDLDVAFDSSIESAIGEVGVVPWTDHLSSMGFLRALKQSFLSRLSYELSNYFASSEEFDGEDFTICVSKIQLYETKCRMLICAKG